MNVAEVDKLELTDERFQAWWGHLDSMDRDEFKTIYAGDDILARFVCSLDYLMLNKYPAKDVEELCVVAFYLAVKPSEPDIDLLSKGTRNRAMRAWKSDATQALYDRVKYRSVRQQAMRLQTKLFDICSAMAEDALRPDATSGQKKDAADTLLKVSKLISEDEAMVRAERTKRGLVRAREALSGEQDTVDLRTLKALTGAAVDQYGKDVVDKALSD